MISKEQFKAIAALDLTAIKAKLMHVESGEGWSLEHAAAVEIDYRRFLYLRKMFPNEETVPLVDVDIFWHYHILDTVKYAADCQAVFGCFLHHFPYVGMRGENDEQVRQRSGERMRTLYQQTFGCNYLGSAAPATNVATAVCAATKARFCAATGAQPAFCA